MTVDSFCSDFVGKIFAFSRKSTTLVLLISPLSFRLFGNEDVDLRQLPQVDETAPPLTESPKIDINLPENEINGSPQMSPKKDWNEVKEKTEEVKKTPSKLDLVRAKLAEATKGKDRLGRPLLFSKYLYRSYLIHLYFSGASHFYYSTWYLFDVKFGFTYC